jgi:hypothetical protein
MPASQHLTPSPFEGRGDQLYAALLLLYDAHGEAIRLAQDTPCLTVPLPSQGWAGLTTADLRWLLDQGYVEYVAEGAEVPASQTVTSTALVPHAVGTAGFRLTAKGLTLARHAVGLRPLLGRPARAGSGRGSAEAQLSVPCWRHDLRELWFRERLVKRFLQPALNQESVLAEFQQHGWPSAIADPLTPAPGFDAPQRLHDTIKCLNQHQSHRLIRFRGDGSGRGVRWQPLE